MDHGVIFIMGTFGLLLLWGAGSIAVAAVVSRLRP